MKKIFSFFLSLLMIFQLAVPLTASAGDNDNPSVYISANRVTPGETVKMPVIITDAANLLGFKLTFGLALAVIIAILLKREN